MGSSLIKKVTPQEVCNLERYSIGNSADHSDISRANFRFLQRLTVTGYNQQQTIWIAENIRNPKQRFLVKQIDKLILYDNNRIYTSLKQLQLWQDVYKENNIASLFFGSLLFAFQDYQFLYMVYEKIQGFTLDSVLKHHIFNEEQTKYVVAVLIQIMEFFHQKKYSLAELSSQHLIVQKKTGAIKLLQIFNPMQIDTVYTYNIITNPSVYAAPEVLAKNKILAESDYYTLGTIMYQMMTQKNVVLQELSHLQVIERHHIMAQQIQLKKYNLPQGWDPQAVDFLVKLLIKNPVYRLGRYGSFQLRFHPWLQNYNWGILDTRQGLSLTEPFFRKQEIKRFPDAPNIDLKGQFQKVLRLPLFIKLFEKYTYRKKFVPKDKQNQEEQQIQKQSIKIKKSQKYYDNHSDGHNSSQSPDQQQYCDDLQMESESLGNSHKGSEAVRSKNGRGLLNIVEKGF